MRQRVASERIVVKGYDNDVIIYKSYHQYEIDICFCNSVMTLIIDCPDAPDNGYLDMAIEDYGTDNWPDSDKESSIGPYARTIAGLGVDADIDKLESEGLPNFAVPFVREFLTEQTERYASAVVNDYWWTKHNELNTNN
ncbi:MAG: hypothetical protein IKE69_11625 [Thermoguttaceae bacterium]|nr:hypothetical protein [Thermoguttaceae bacterium]